MKRVVITGIGSINALGNGVEAFAAGLRAGRSAIDRLTVLPDLGFRATLAAEVRDLSLPEGLPAAVIRRASRTTALALTATAEALTSAGLDERRTRAAGVVIGTTTGGLSRGEENCRRLLTGVPAPVDIAGWLETPVAVPADVIAHVFGCRGERTTLSTACSSGAHALIAAAERIRCGRATTVVCGGVDALCLLTYSGFDSLKAIDPEPCRPFDRRRAGLTLGEGAAMFVFEDLESALARGARPLAEFVGGGMSADAHHLTQPRQDGAGAIQAMQAALAAGGVEPEEIDYINAHGTGTPHNDGVETRAIKAVLGDHARQIPVSSTKSMIGHCLGAAGALEALACVLAIRDGFVPPTVNLHEADPECDLDYVAGAARPASLRTILSSSYGFGGNNAAIVLRAPGDGLEARAIARDSIRSSLRGPRGDAAALVNTDDAVVITGVGVVSALGADADRFWRRLCAGQTGIVALETVDGTRRPSIGGPARDFDPRRRIRSRHRRRMDRLSAMIVSAAREALEDAGLDVEAATERERECVSVCVGSAFGNLSESMSHARRLFGRGARSVSPMTFPNLVLNAPASYLAIELGATGPNLTVSQLELSGEQALLAAHDLLVAGRADVVIAGGGDELAQIAVDAYRDARALSGQRGGPEWSSPYDRARNGVVLGEGAGMLVLERRSHAARRGAHAYAVLEAVAATAFPTLPYSWPQLADERPLRLPASLGALGLAGRPFDLIAGSAASTRAHDASELALVEAITAESAADGPWLTSIKGATGEFGAAGALTTIAAALAVDRQKVPPLRAMDRAEDCRGVRYAPRAAVDARIERALVLGLARGGACTALVLRKA